MYIYIYAFVHLANRSGGSCLFSKGGVNEEKRLCAQMNKISGFYVNLARSRFLYRNPKLDRTLEALKYSIFLGGTPMYCQFPLEGLDSKINIEAMRFSRSLYYHLSEIFKNGFLLGVAVYVPLCCEKSWGFDQPPKGDSQS